MVLLDPKEAIKELKQKTQKEIQEQTAITWGNRSAAAFINSKSTGDEQMKLTWFLAGEEYLHESIEHAALMHDDGVFLSKIEKEVEAYREIALKDLKASI